MLLSPPPPRGLSLTAHAPGLCTEAEGEAAAFGNIRAHGDSGLPAGGLAGRETAGMGVPRRCGEEEEEVPVSPPGRSVQPRQRGAARGRRGEPGRSAHCSVSAPLLRRFESRRMTGFPPAGFLSCIACERGMPYACQVPALVKNSLGDCFLPSL